MSAATDYNLVNPEVGNSNALHFFLKYNNQAENLDRLLKAGIGIAAIGQMKSSSPTWGKAGDVLDSARSVVSISRTPGIVVKLCTGSIWTHYVQKKIDLNGYVDINGNLVKVSNVSGQVVDGTNADGTVRIVQNVITVEERRDWSDIACDVLLLAARLLNPIYWLNKLGAIDLGKHAARIGTAIGCAFTAVTTLCFVQSIRDLIESIEAREMGEEFSQMMSRIKKKIADCFSSFIDMLSIPADWGMTFNASPAMALASASMSVASGVVFLAKEMFMD